MYSSEDSLLQGSFVQTWLHQMCFLCPTQSSNMFPKVVYPQAFLPALRPQQSRGHPLLCFKMVMLKTAAHPSWYFRHLELRKHARNDCFVLECYRHYREADCVLCSVYAVSLVWEGLALSDSLHMSHSAPLGMWSAPWGGCRCSQLLKRNPKWKQLESAEESW